MKDRRLASVLWCTLSSSSDSSRRSPPGDSRRCTFEQLEERCLLSASMGDARHVALQSLGVQSPISHATGRAEDAKTKLIGNGVNGGPVLTAGDEFGHAIAAIGDLDGDGVNDIAVGAVGDRTGGGYDRGAVYVEFMNADGTVKSNQKIAHNTGGGPSLDYFVNFGSAITSLGDLDGDGVSDLAVGARYDTTGDHSGAVYVLFMNPAGTAKSVQKIGSDLGGGPTLPRWEGFGSALANIGDLDGDGVSDLAVGADVGRYGSVYVLFMNTDGTVKNSQEIGHEVGGGPDSLQRDSYFGSAVAALGDIDGDGVTDIAVGAMGEEIDLEHSSNYNGAVYILHLNTDGSARQWERFAGSDNGGPPAIDDQWFGSSLAALGDINGDGITDLAVGGEGYGQNYSNQGALYILQLNADGTANTCWRIAENQNGGPTLDEYSHFGSALTSLGDLDGDGVLDLAVGARGADSNNGFDDPKGAAYVLFLRPVTPDYGDAPDTGTGNGPGNYSTTAAENGPSHIILAGLHIGARVDGDMGALQNAAATADSADGILPTDEDGLVNPVADLQITVGTQPTIGVWLTNITGAIATLYGWIDYNGDGVFDSATERAAATVPDGTESGEVTLTFPTVPHEKAWAPSSSLG